MTNARARLIVIHSRSAREQAVGLTEQLRSDGFDAAPLVLAGDLIDALSRADPDLVVVSYVDGSFNVARLCRDLSSAADWRIVVVVSSPDSHLDDDLIVDVLDSGADAVISRSASPDLLVARLRVAMRTRPEPKPIEQQPIVIGDVEIDVGARNVSIGGSNVRLVRLQFDLLVALASRLGRAVSADQLLTDVWGVSPGSVNPQRLRIAVSGLRRILGHGPGRPEIELVAPFSYRLLPPGSW